MVSRGRSIADAVRPIAVTKVTYNRWRDAFGLKTEKALAI
jgi:hypothetical protein